MTNSSVDWLRAESQLIKILQLSGLDNSEEKSDLIVWPTIEKHQSVIIIYGSKQNQDGNKKTMIPRLLKVSSTNKCAT